jgi:Phage capsid family
LLVRYVAAHLLSTAGRRSMAEIVRQRWPRDELLLKAATAPATLTTSGWADTLSQTAVADFINGMSGASAAATLLQRGTQLRFDGSGAILVPGVVSSADKAAFVTEGAPIPVEQLALSGPTLSPRKLASIATFTGQLADHSTPTIEAVVRQSLTEAVGLAFDAILFDATTGDATRPAGLRAGISATTASAATPNEAAMIADLSTLAGAVAGVAGSAPIVFVASPRQAHAVRMRQPNLPYEILPSSGLAAGIVVAIASNALVSATDPTPRIDVSDQAVLAYDDATPAHIGTSGTPNVVAASRSLFQSDLIGIKLILEVSWALRNAGGLAWTQSVVW